MASRKNKQITSPKTTSTILNQKKRDLKKKYSSSELTELYNNNISKNFKQIINGAKIIEKKGTVKIGSNVYDKKEFAKLVSDFSKTIKNQSHLKSSSDQRKLNSEEEKNINEFFNQKFLFEEECIRNYFEIYDLPKQFLDIFINKLIDHNKNKKNKKFSEFGRKKSSISKFSNTKIFNSIEKPFYISKELTDFIKNENFGNGFVFLYPEFQKTEIEKINGKKEPEKAFNALKNKLGSDPSIKWNIPKELILQIADPLFFTKEILTKQIINAPILMKLINLYIRANSLYTPGEPGICLNEPLKNFIYENNKLFNNKNVIERYLEKDPVENGKINKKNLISIFNFHKIPKTCPVPLEKKEKLKDKKCFISCIAIKNII